MQECYEGCPDSPNILDLCDPGTEEAAVHRNVNDSGKTNRQHLMTTKNYIIKLKQKSKMVKHNQIRV